MKPTPALLATVVGLQLLTGCGGGESVGPPPPPPPPALVVTTIEVTPAAPSLVAPDTVRLRATVKDQNGTTMAGKTVTWTSGTPAVATVAADGLVTVASGGQVVITAAVDGKSGSATVTAAAAVDLAGGAAVSGTIGPKGGILTTTGPGGVTYRFEVPPRALAASQSITMTPITALRTLGAVTFEAGVRFAPSGLTFAVPALLRISKKVTVASGNRLIGIGTNDAGRQISLASAITDSAGLVLPVTHFSSAAAAQGTPAQLGQLPAAPVAVPTRLNDYSAGIAALNDLMIRGVDTPQNIERVFHQWLLEWLEPEFANAARPPLFASDAVSVAVDFAVWIWEYESRHPGTPQGQALQDQTRARAGVSAVLRLVIDQLALECPVRRSLTVLEDANWIAGVAVQFGLSATEPALAKDRIAAAMCATIIVTQLDYPDPAIPNQASPLLIRAGVRFGNDPAQPLFDTKLELSALIFGGSPTTEVGTTDPTGRYQFSVRPDGTSTLRVGGVLCLPTDRTTMADYARDMFCGGFTLDRPFGRTIDATVVVFSQQGLEGLRDVARINGDLRISPTSTLTTTDLTELSQLATVTGNFTIGGAGSLRKLDGLRGLTTVGGTLQISANSLLTDISGLSSLRQLGGLFVTSNGALVSLHGLEQVTTLDVGGLNVTDMPTLATLNGLVGLRRVRSLRLQNSPLISSLQSLRGTAIAENLIVTKMNALPSLKDLTGVAQFLADVVISDNAGLLDIGALTNVASVRSVSIRANPLLPDVHELSNLTSTLPNGARIDGPLFTSLAGLSKLQHSGPIQLDGSASPLLNTIVLPALQDVTGTNGFRFDVGTGAFCPAGRNIAISLPQLTATSALAVGSGSAVPLPGCSITFSAPQLGTATQGVGLTGGITAFTLGPSLTAQSLGIGFTRLQALNLPVLNVGTLDVRENPFLTALGSGSGSVTTEMRFQNNPNLSTQAIINWSKGFSKVQSLVTSGNKVP